MHASRQRWAMVAIVSLAISGSVAAPASATTSGTPGDATIAVDLNDSTAGGTYEQAFEKAFAGTTGDGTPVYIYVPEGAIGDPTVASMDPQYDHNPDDEFVPCASTPDSDFLITQEQIDTLGNTLADQIVEVDEAHFGPMGEAVAGDPATEALVTLVYNVQDDNYYDCEETTYTAGYFAPEYINEAGMNVIVIDAFDWANRIGDQTGNEDGRSYLYEGVIAHELEHLLHNYSDPGELSWVDEGLADFAGFLNGFDVGGSHLTYHQVFHRETSLTRWGGGLENYGASYTFTQYLWEQAGGNGDGSYTTDLEYDGAGGDLLIKRIFQEPADGMEGVQNAIDTFNAETNGAVKDVDDLFRDWALAVKYDVEGDELLDIRSVDFGDPASTRWTIDIANDAFWSGRGQYNGAMPEGKVAHHPDVAGQRALPYGLSYESFRNPGPRFDLTFDGDESTVIAPHTGATHWYSPYESQADSIVDVAADGDVDSVDFWTWYFIEEGWDYGFVEALVGGGWVTVPLKDDGGNVVTTNTDPHDNNEEGNGLTGTSGGRYFVDDPTYIHLTADLSGLGTVEDVRFRYSTDAAYLDTGWFIDDVMVDGGAAALSSDTWTETSGEQVNSWTVQIITPCDLGIQDAEYLTFTDSDGTERTVYRFDGDVSLPGLSGDCLHRNRFEVIISNLPSGDLQFLDADYTFRVTQRGKASGKSA